MKSWCLTSRESRYLTTTEISQIHYGKPIPCCEYSKLYGICQDPVLTEAQKADCSPLLLKPLIVGSLGSVEIAALMRQVCRKLYYCQCYQNKRKINDAFKQSNCRPRCIMLHNSCNLVLRRACRGSAVIVGVHIPLSLEGFGPVSATSIACPTALHNACIRKI